MTSAEVRSELADALKLDLVGPVDNGGRPLGDPIEILPQAPSRWYLTGFLVPLDAPEEQRSELAADDDLDSAGEPGVDDDAAPEPAAAAKQRYLPSSMGVSVLLPAEASTLNVQVRWGDYKLSGEIGTQSETWNRTPQDVLVALRLKRKLARPEETKVPASGGLRLAIMIQPVGDSGPDSGLPAGARTVSVFLVNKRTAAEDNKRDEAFAFQVELELSADTPFLARPDARGLVSDEWDENVADLQYADVGEYAVGHNVSGRAVVGEGGCRKVLTFWIPEAQVERVAPAAIKSVELGMDALAELKDAGEARTKLMPLVERYRAWIAGQTPPPGPKKRHETARQLATNATVAANRIQAGIELLSDRACFDAFIITNRVMAKAARRRFGVMKGKAESAIDPPSWRPFQLAFLLMNLSGIAKPESDDRNVVDLLFFPTGGGKTEAYLGLAAFTLVLRRTRNPGVTGAGVSVLMRYTLRLLTLDQLGRAATLICALELEREQDEKTLGTWPFEIGLWVGRAATPNEMGSKDRDHPDTARRRTISLWNDDRKPSPIPLEECPWCGEKFKQQSFRLVANGRSNRDYPTDLVIGCVNRECDFSRDRFLPIVAVDEPLYRRLPCFVIATVDKFAAMPWTGAVGGLFGRVDRQDRDGFYGPCDPGRGSMLPGGRLPPPDLIIQDELHLISGPLGTMVGLYETALEELACRDGLRPKIIASTATVRRADSQIRALFNRSQVDIFPPPGPDRRDSFFAQTLQPREDDDNTNARLYLGVAAQGRSPKVAMLRVYLALLGAGQKWYGRTKAKENPADPYMTLVGYFNSLRELGGSRRLIEDEVRYKLFTHGSRRKIGESEGLFADREIDYEPVELTSRVNTSSVAEAKRKLSLAFDDKSSVDVAIATNMISVGLDITRLGLMVVFGQPKTSAEYIQATSRVGRDPQRPGLVVTILNVHKPRDRSHFERFVAYHQTFYRSVEATSVTPFSPRALDKGLAAALVAFARLGHDVLTPPNGAMEILSHRAQLSSLVDKFGDRAENHALLSKEEQSRLRTRVRQRCEDLLDDWVGVVQDQKKVGAPLQYNIHERGAGPPLLQEYLDPALKGLPPGHWKRKFRANRSMRDVEPSTNLWVRTMDNIELDEDDG